MKNSHTDIKNELMQSSAVYFAPVLTKAGFVSYRSDQLNWFRMSNDVLQHIHICLPTAAAPACVYFIYGAHSLFQWAEPNPGLYTCSASYSGLGPPLMEPLHFGHHFSPLNGRSPIYYAEDLPQRGGERLEDTIVPLLDCLRTSEAAYQYHIKCEREAAERLGEVGSNLKRLQFFEPRLMDEILFFRDKSAYDFLKHYLNYRAEWYKDDPDSDVRCMKACKTQVQKTRLLLGDGLHIREHLQLLENAMTRDEWEPFDEVILQRTELNINELRKKVPELFDRS